MGRVNLSRLWYIFPPDDQELKPAEFERKLTSFLSTLPLPHKLALLEFLTIQYAAFARQLEVLRARKVLSQPEHAERSEKLSSHLTTLRRCRSALETSPVAADYWPWPTALAHATVLEP